MSRSPSTIDNLLRSAKTQNASQAATLDALEEALKLRAQELEKAHILRQTAQNEISVLRGELDAHIAARATLEAENQTLQTELSRVKNDLEDAEGRGYVKAQDELAKARADLERALRDAEAARGERDALKKDMEAVERIVSGKGVFAPLGHKRPADVVEDLPQSEEENGEDRMGTGSNKRQKRYDPARPSQDSEPSASTSTTVPGPSSLRNVSTQGPSELTVHLSSPPVTPIRPQSPGRPCLNAVQGAEPIRFLSLEEQEFLDAAKVAGVQYNNRLQKVPHARSKLATLQQQQADWASLTPNWRQTLSFQLAAGRRTLCAVQPRIFMQAVVKAETDRSALSTRRSSSVFPGLNAPTRDTHYTHVWRVKVDRTNKTAQLVRKELTSAKPILSWGLDVEETDFLAVVIHDEEAECPIQIELRALAGEEKGSPPAHDRAAAQTLGVQRQDLPPRRGVQGPPTTSCEVAHDLLALSVQYGVQGDVFIYLYDWMNGDQVSQRVRAGASHMTFLQTRSLSDDANPQSNVYLITLSADHSALDVSKCDVGGATKRRLFKCSFQLPATMLGNAVNPNSFRVHAQRPMDATAQWAAPPDDYFIHDPETACVFVSYETTNEAAEVVSRHVFIIQRQPFVELLEQETFSARGRVIGWEEWRAYAAVLDGEKYVGMSAVSIVGQRVLGMQRLGSGTHLCLLDFNASKVARFESAHRSGITSAGAVVTRVVRPRANARAASAVTYLETRSKAVCNFDEVYMDGENIVGIKWENRDGAGGGATVEVINFGATVEVRGRFS
ncbi:hypothetical protein MKEN_00456300 [Mycena kentingensis (nom. inval.)]|nr:hypothetical protein MKEN_00456300 [Mycena kentingensis (nom. inval.)]